MELSRIDIRQAPFESVADLTANIPVPKYCLREYRLKSGADQTWFVVEKGPISIVVLKGVLELHSSDGKKESFSPEQGCHLFEGSKFQLKTALEAHFLVAAASFPTFGPMSTYSKVGDFKFESLSPYRVQKPWGYEIWYSMNLKDPKYALKLISMTEGNQSSLQSHVQKSETNFVFEGEAEVLYGMKAPTDLTAKIDVKGLSKMHRKTGEGWSNEVQEVHRVIAKTTYKAIEISTPEIDDVIRWQDDNARSHGRIASEHTASL